MQFVCKEWRAVGTWIEIQQQATVRFQKTRSDILDEKFPIGGRPFYPFAVFVARDPVKTNAMRRDEIEFFFEIGQWNPGLNTRDHAPYV